MAVDLKESSTLENKIKCINCYRCGAKNYVDTKLYKEHLWQVHIPYSEQMMANTKLTGIKPAASSGSTLQENNKTRETSALAQEEPESKPIQVAEVGNSENNVVEAKPKRGRKKRKLSNENNEEDADKENLIGMDTIATSGSFYSEENKITREEKIKQTISKLSAEDSDTFNLENIDEKVLFSRTAFLYGDKDSSNKIREFKNGRIGWAMWRIKGSSIMWPCKLENLTREKNTIKVGIRYYENHGQFSHVFKLDLIKVELFFRNSQHYYYKRSSLLNPKLDSYEFATCYTEALKDYVKQLESLEVDREKFEADYERTEKNLLGPLSSKRRKSNSSGGSTSNRSSTSDGRKEYLVNNNMISLNQVRQIASRGKSEQLLQTIQERTEKSNALTEKILTPECKEYLISIFTSNAELNPRHDKYLKADVLTRREMDFKSPGPLIEEDQQKVAAFVTNIEEEYYLDKPANLTKYNYDVLYPEAVIWALRKMNSRLSYLRAEKIYQESFKQTEEEMEYQRCHEILNRLPSQSNEEQSWMHNSNDFEDVNISVNSSLANPSQESS